MASVTHKGAALVTLMVAFSMVGGPAQAGAPKEPKEVKLPKLSKLATEGIGGTLWGDDDTKQGKQATKPTGSWDAALDRGSMYSLTASIGAQDAWAQGVTGKDVTIAVIDTGVAPVPGLDDDHKVNFGPDLSFDSQMPGTRYVDGFGHGTHMAGIIAGKDPGFDPKKPSSRLFAGVAPDAELLSMKVASGDGGADVSQVIAAIDWVVEHADDAGMHVRVINLSYGTESDQVWQVDPLARAVENAWKNGIVVVAAAGNNGSGRKLLMPALDPHIISVGAVDHGGTASTLDDRVADFTNSGDTNRRPDLLAPGKSVVSLRVPGSFADIAHPEGQVDGDDSGRFFRGSGTSQATAVVAGEAALLLDAQSKLTPDQVKALLTGTARPLALDRDPAQGAGVTDVGAAVRAIKAKLPLITKSASRQTSDGSGTLEASRGGEHVVDPSTGDVLEGEVDALGGVWNPARWAAAESTGTTWTKGSFNGRLWTGTKWDKHRLQAASWVGDSWGSVRWEKHTWSEDQWAARSWRGDNWKARSWREASWSARSWRGVS